MQLPLGFERSKMRLAVLGSGSSGNAVVVESGDRRLLLDAGFSCRELERRLGLVGVDPDTIGAIVVTHEHGDHIRGAPRFARRHGLEIWATAGTLEELDPGKGPPLATRVVRSGERAEIAGFEVEPFAVPHDAREPVGFVVEDAAGSRVGLAADLGVPSRLAWGRLVDLDVLLLEANHDLELLRSGPYPWPVKERIASRHGHLSNRAAAEALPELLCDRLGRVVLYHLSRTNNLAALALDELGSRLAEEGSEAELTVARQDAPTDWLVCARSLRESVRSPG